MAGKHSRKKKKTEKNTNSWKTFLIIIAIILILFIAAFFGLKNARNQTINEQIVKYNNYEFRLLEDDAWYVDLSIKGKLYTIPFYYTPDEVDYVDIQNESLMAIGLFNKFKPGGKIYMSIDPNESSKIVIAGVEVARILGSKYDIYNFDVESAFYKNPGENYSGRPIITCANATKNTLVILLAVGDKDRVRAVGNCILLESENLNNSIKVADAFAYKLLKIIP